MVTVSVVGQLPFIALVTEGAKVSRLRLLDTCSHLFSLDPDVDVWENLENILVARTQQDFRVDYEEPLS